jgi:hypothetical protein
MEIQQDKEDIEDYKAYLKAWKRFMQVQEVERQRRLSDALQCLHRCGSRRALPRRWRGRRSRRLRRSGSAARRSCHGADARDAGVRGRPA